MPLEPSWNSPRVALGLAAAVLCIWSPSSAQEASTSRDGPLWTMEGLRSGQCVRFLMEPGAAGKHVKQGARLLRADQDSSLHPVLQTIIGEQTEFARWVPSSLCIFYSDAIRLSGRRLGSKDPRKKQMLGFWTVAAVESGGSRQDIVLDLFGNSGSLVRAAELGKVKLREARSTVSKPAGTSNDVYDIQIGKTRLIWNGRATGDSSAVGAVHERWLTRGASGTFWRVNASLRPGWTRPVVGVLTVEGKDDLARALKSSPTRFVGPLYLGGEGELRFYR